jgi:hypothetical protein
MNENEEKRESFNEDDFLSAHAGLADSGYQDWYDEFLNASPRTDPPFVVHHSGPDDVYPARTWREAVGVAHELNAGAVTYTKRTSHDGMVRSWATPYVTAEAVRLGVITATAEGVSA